jgi:hypothetical protein
LEINGWWVGVVLKSKMDKAGGEREMDGVFTGIPSRTR